MLPPWFGDGWQREDIRVFEGEDLFNHINGAAELFVELGFERVRVAKYIRGEAQLGVEIYEMRSPVAARALFYHFGRGGSASMAVGGRNVTGTHQIILQEGPYYVTVSNYTGAAALANDAAGLARRVRRGLPGDAPVGLLDLLPPGYVPGSEAIARGPVGMQAVAELGEGDMLQLRGETFAVAADYRNAEGKTYTLLRVQYDTPDDALAAWQHLKAHWDPYLKILRQTEDEIIFEDYAKQFGHAMIRDDTITFRLRLAETPQMPETT